MKIKTFLIRFLTWWNDQTFGTQVWTSLYGEFVGEDEHGNRYYRTKGGKIDPALGYERRWVIYNGDVEASRIGADLARLDPPHPRAAADRGDDRGAAVVEAAPSQPDRHARRLAPARLDARRPAAARARPATTRRGRRDRSAAAIATLETERGPSGPRFLSSLRGAKPTKQSSPCSLD